MKRVVALALLSCVVVDGVFADCMAAEVRHESLRIHSPRLGEERRINVYLPPAYDRCPGQRYRVLYMPDGGVAEDFPHVASAVDDLVRASRIEPLIVVGLENTNRRRDMTGPTTDPEDRKVTDQPGGAAKLRDFLRHELQPIVDARYRTNDARAIIGESFAGLFIVEAMLRTPDLFDTYIALDPSLWWNKGGLIGEVPSLLSAWSPHAKVRLFVASTGDGNTQEVEAFDAALRAANTPALQWTYEPRPDLRHGNIYLSMEREVLTTLFPRDANAPADCGS